MCSGSVIHLVWLPRHSRIVRGCSLNKTTWNGVKVKPGLCYNHRQPALIVFPISVIIVFIRHSYVALLALETDCSSSRVTSWIREEKRTTGSFVRWVQNYCDEACTTATTERTTTRTVALYRRRLRTTYTPHLIQGAVVRSELTNDIPRVFDVPSWASIACL